MTHISVNGSAPLKMQGTAWADEAPDVLIKWVWKEQFDPMNVLKKIKVTLSLIYYGPDWASTPESGAELSYTLLHCVQPSKGHRWLPRAPGQLLCLTPPPACPLSRGELADLQKLWRSGTGRLPTPLLFGQLWQGHNLALWLRQTSFPDTDPKCQPSVYPAKPSKLQ